MTNEPAPLAFAIAAGALAFTFRDMLARDLDPLEWRTMRIRNRYAADGVCASHDFLDANMTMLEAFEQLTGRYPALLCDDATDDQKDADTALWNAASGIAKPLHLTSCEDWSTNGDAFDAWRCSGVDVDRLKDHAELVGDIDGEHGGRVYNVGFVEYMPYGAGIIVACICGNADIAEQDLFAVERFLWDNYAASEMRHG